MLFRWIMPLQSFYQLRGSLPMFSCTFSHSLSRRYPSLDLKCSTEHVTHAVKMQHDIDIRHMQHWCSRPSVCGQNISAQPVPWTECKCRRIQDDATWCNRKMWRSVATQLYHALSMAETLKNNEHLHKLFKNAEVKSRRLWFDLGGV